MKPSWQKPVIPDLCWSNRLYSQVWYDRSLQLLALTSDQTHQQCLELFYRLQILPLILSHACTQTVTVYLYIYVTLLQSKCALSFMLFRSLCIPLYQQPSAIAKYHLNIE